MIEEIREIIRKNLGMDGLNVSPECKLGDTGIGLDSQEIIEFTCLIEKHFHIALPPICFNKGSSIGDVIQRIEMLKHPGAESMPLFEGAAEVFLDMKCTPQAAYQAIYEMEKWPSKLPHVKRIETLYNDGMYQEFLMDVQSDTGMIRVRSIRRCDPQAGIFFFQPKPPVFLTHHCGGWCFEPSASGCRVTTWHDWNLEKQKAEELFGEKAKEQIDQLLRGHAEFALNHWKSILEKKE